jgi:tetratricopeptide (TPR) repeat protein
VAALVDGDAQLDQRLIALVRKELVRPDRAQLAGDDAYRFRHLLIRDAAYDALPKATRADLHRRFASWLEQHGANLVELDEILGYHLEQAARYLEELGQPEPEIALAAGDRLGEAGARARWTGDMRTAAVLLDRALTLTRPYRFEGHLEAALMEALRTFDVAKAVSVADAADRRALAAGDEPAALLAATVAALQRLEIGQCTPDEVEQLAHQALPLLEATEDDEGLVNVWSVLGWVANMRFNYEGWAHAQEQALRHAGRAGLPLVGSFYLAVPLTVGPRPASEALATLDAVVDQPHPGDLVMRGVMLAMLDRLDEAWATALPAAERMREFGYATVGVWLGEIAEIAGDDELAARHLLDGCDAMEKAGNIAVLSSYAPHLGRVLHRLGRYEEVEPLAQKGRELGDPDDILTQVEWRETQALVHSARGEHADAARLAREAVEFSMRGDAVMRQGDAFSDLADVLEAGGRRQEAIGALHDALERYERKEAIPLARRARERLALLEETLT